MGMSSRTTDLVQAHILLLLPGEPGFASFLLDSLSLLSLQHHPTMSFSDRKKDDSEGKGMEGK